jgi:hypothetical protein
MRSDVNFLQLFTGGLLLHTAQGSCARICKSLRSPGINSKESVPPAYVAWWAGTSNRVLVLARQAGNRFLGSLKCLQIGALSSRKLALYWSFFHAADGVNKNFHAYDKSWAPTMEKVSDNRHRRSTANTRQRKPDNYQQTTTTETPEN